MKLMIFCFFSVFLELFAHLLTKTYKPLFNLKKQRQGKSLKHKMLMHSQKIRWVEELTLRFKVEIVGVMCAPVQQNRWVCDAPPFNCLEKNQSCRQSKKHES
jgi:hypothetical protein